VKLLSNLRAALFESLTLVCLLCAAQPAFAQFYEGKELVKARLVADTTAAVPGSQFMVGLELEHAEGWHTYWKYSGDSGVPTSVKWELPEGVTIGEWQWPLPQWYREEGDLEVYVYKDKVMLVAPVHVSADFTGESLQIKGKAKWLVCEKVCIPGDAELELSLPVADAADGANLEPFTRAKASLPQSEPPPFLLSWNRAPNRVILETSGVSKTASLTFYPLPPKGWVLGHPAISQLDEAGRWRVEIPIEGGDLTQGRMGGVVILEEPEQRIGWEISEPDVVEEIPSAGAAADGEAPTNTSAGGDPVQPMGPLRALLYGFLGGFILNLMPCVLPVISLKIFGFIKHAGDSPQRIFRTGLAFTAGIFAWFTALGLLISIMVWTGREVSWAFQFQNPWFNLAVSVIVFVFALNLFGVFVIVLPGAAGTRLAEWSSREGYSGAFLQGVFATVLATPCTAPFLAAALGFALLGRNAGVILLLFAAIALGMSLPYLILSARPSWIARLPKPGPWMVHVKEFMGFLLLATLVWFLSIIGRLAGLDGIVWTLALLLMVGIAVWIYGHFGRKPAGVATAAIVALVGLLYFGGVHFAQATQRKADTPVASKPGGIEWQDFSTAALEEAVGSGKIVFVDFTAQWCLTCKFNERTVIETDTVREWMAANEVVPFKADWTHSDPEISKLLAQHGRVGVPFYLIYSAGDLNNPVVLPELLTKTILLNGFAEAKKRAESVSGS
jgi:thiol:disulfide interchange protein/DsbC/DsbD-like thiol-disulfide interchange protein